MARVDMFAFGNPVADLDRVALNGLVGYAKRLVCSLRGFAQRVGSQARQPEPSCNKRSTSTPTFPFLMPPMRGDCWRSWGSSAILTSHSALVCEKGLEMRRRQG